MHGRRLKQYPTSMWQGHLASPQEQHTHSHSPPTASARRGGCCHWAGAGGAGTGSPWGCRPRATASAGRQAAGPRHSAAPSEGREQAVAMAWGRAGGMTRCTACSAQVPEAATPPSEAQCGSCVAAECKAAAALHAACKGASTGQIHSTAHLDDPSHDVLVGMLQPFEAGRLRQHAARRRVGEGGAGVGAAGHACERRSTCSSFQGRVALKRQHTALQTESSRSREEAPDECAAGRGLLHKVVGEAVGRQLGLSRVGGGFWYRIWPSLQFQGVWGS